jgi:hypothetical protein
MSEHTTVNDLTQTEHDLIAAYRSKDWPTMGRLLDETVPSDTEAAPEPVTPSAEQEQPTTSIYENPSYPRFKPKHLRTAWWVIGALIGSYAINLPDFDDDDRRWPDLLEEFVPLVADIIARTE